VTVRQILRVFLLFVIATVAWAGTAAAEPVSVRGGGHEGYGRLVFNWRIPVVYSANIVEGNLVLEFGRPIEASYGGAVRNLRRYLRAAQPSPDGLRVTFPLAGDFGLRHFYMGSAVVVDVLDQAPVAAAEPTPTKPTSTTPAAESAPPPPPVPDAAEAPSIRVRSGEHEGYSRLVFDWPRKVGYRIDRDGGTATVSFDRRARVDLRRLRRRLPKFIRGLESRVTDGGLEVTLKMAETSRVRDFVSGSKVVVDVMAPSAAETAEKPAAPAKPPPKKEETKEPPKAPEAAAGEVAEATPDTPPATTEATAETTPKPTSLVPSDAGGETAAEKPAAPEAAVVSDGPVGTVTLRFDWKDPVGAAVFRRAGTLWLVFDSDTTIDLEALTAAGGNAIRAITRVPVEKATALRFDTVSGVNPELRRDGLAWILEFKKRRLSVNTPIEIQADPNSPIGARVFLPVAQPGTALIVGDPEVGDSLVVVPVIPLGHGVKGRRRYPQFDVLGSAQGVVIQPRIDDLRVRTLVQGVELTSAGSLQISVVTPNVEAEAKIGAMRELTRTFDLQEWRDASMTDFIDIKRDLENAVAVAEKGKRQKARMDLARFYFAIGFAPEALGVLRVMVDAQPEFAQDPRLRAMRGASKFLMGRYDLAAKDLAHESLDGNDEGAFWRAAVRAAGGDIIGAADALRRTGGITFPYPPALKFRMATMVAEAAIEVGDIKQATRYLEMLGGESPNPAQKGNLLYVIGRLKELAGDFDGAVADWEEVQEGPHRPSRAKASVARAELLFKLRQISRAETIEELEKLRFAWRGDDFEFDLLWRLGTLYLEEGDARDGLRTLRQAATYFRKHEKAPEVTQQMADAFHALYLENRADSLAPVTAIALYEEFKELTPAGAKGDEMIRKLADRLVGVDLLDRAAELLENQVQFRLKGVERSRVGAQLAIVHMLNRLPEKAQGVLKATEIKGAPPELVTQRRHLLARALAGMDQTPEALALIKEDDSREAELLRTGMYWNSRDWTNASQSLRRLINEFEVEKDKALDERQGGYILNLAIALTLSGNERAVDRLRQKFGADMDNLSYKDAFRLIASPETVGLLDHRTIADKVESAQQFQEFMAAYRERVRSGNLSAVN
jgi:tetratricopeptide (TPR) repeat protein